MELLAFYDYFQTVIELVLIAVVIMLFREQRTYRDRLTSHEVDCKERQKTIHGKIDALMREVAQISGKLDK